MRAEQLTSPTGGSTSRDRSVQDQGRSSTSGVYLWVSLAAWRSFKCQTLCTVAGAALAKVTVQRHMWRLALVANGNCGKQQQLTHNDFLPCNLKFMLKSCYSDRVVGGTPQSVSQSVRFERPRGSLCYLCE